jgi:hypothetical protein
MTNALTFRALAALPPPLQTLARQHIAAHPCDDLSELISELAIAAIELADAATDARHIYNRARSRLRRQTQDPAHYATVIDDAHHDIERDDEQSALRRADIVREIARQRGISLRRAQQIVSRQLARAAQGDLFSEAGGAV